MASKKRIDQLRCLWIHTSLGEKKAFMNSLGEMFRIKDYSRCDKSNYGFTGFFDVEVERVIPTGAAAEKTQHVEEEAHTTPDGATVWCYRYRGTIVGYFEPAN